MGETVEVYQKLLLYSIFKAEGLDFVGISLKIRKKMLKLIIIQ